MDIRFIEFCIFRARSKHAVWPRKLLRRDQKRGACEVTLH